MSQSDYIKYKRVSTVLHNDTMPPVMTEQNYIDFKQYTVENTIPDTKLIENTLIPSGSYLIFDMLKQTTSCPTFPLCQNTDTRTNRVAMSTVYVKPKPVPIYKKTPYIPLNMYNCYKNNRYSNSVYIKPSLACTLMQPST